MIDSADFVTAGDIRYETDDLPHDTEVIFINDFLGQTDVPVAYRGYRISMKKCIITPQSCMIEYGKKSVLTTLAMSAMNDDEYMSAVETDESAREAYENLPWKEALVIELVQDRKDV